uniref:Uncharacterized protein n=1 Tax=viral metagenome TaxID=1070528 RepID=A0A6C0DA17_9ZZZZ
MASGQDFLRNMTRSKWDEFHTQDDLRITSYALRYYANPPGINCYESYPVDITTRIQKSGASFVNDTWKTDVESDLFNINRLSTRVKNNNIQYNPETNKYTNAPYVAPKDESVPQLFNRLTNPPCTLRATGWNRWEALPHQPQLVFETPFDFFIPSRDIDKEKKKTH